MEMAAVAAPLKQAYLTSIRIRKSCSVASAAHLALMHVVDWPSVESGALQ